MARLGRRRGNISRRRRAFLIMGVVFLMGGIFSFVLFPPTLTHPDKRVKATSQLRKGDSEKGLFSKLSDQLSTASYYVGKVVAEVIVPRLSPETKARLYTGIKVVSFLCAILKAYFFHFLVLIAAMVLLIRSVLPPSRRRKRR